MTSRTTILSVIYTVAAITLGSILTIAWLVSVNQPVPDAITPIPVGGLTGLLGLLASTRSGLGANEKEPTPLIPAPKPTEPVATTVTVEQTSEPVAEPANTRRP